MCAAAARAALRELPLPFPCCSSCVQQHSFQPFLQPSPLGDAFPELPRAPGACLPWLQEVPVPQLRCQGVGHAGKQPLSNYVSG